MGECDKDTSFAVLDAFFDLGGNFIDTANAYQCEESEEWLGEWMEKKGNRDQMVYVSYLLIAKPISQLTDTTVSRPSTPLDTAIMLAMPNLFNPILSATPSSPCTFPLTDR